MKPQEFEELAFRLWERIPWDYREGVDGLVIERRALPHPRLPDVYTLGECATEAYPSDFGGPDTIRSVVVLYYGSFRALSKLDEAFDWEGELWETLTHELQHHLESLASEDALIDVDYAADESFKRAEGEPFDPFYYTRGTPAAEGVWRIEGDFYIERSYREERELGSEVAIDWHGRSYRVPRPPETGDVCFIRLTDGLDEWPPGEVFVVLARRRGGLASIRAFFRGEQPRVVEAEAVAEPERAA